MVGVPGRSKGCNTCIQRKVRCDGGRPVCGNCRKSNRLCTGYKRSVAFVMSSNVTFVDSASTDDTDSGIVTTHGRWHKRVRQPPQPLSGDLERHSDETESVGTSATTQTTSSSQDATTLPAVASREEIKQCRKSNFAPVRSRGKKKHAMTLDALTKAVANLSAVPTSTPVLADFPYPGLFFTPSRMAMPLPPHLHSDASWREQLFPIFLSFHLPSEVFDSSVQAHPQRPRNWLLNLPETSFAESPALETAMAALCMGRIGRRMGNTALIQHSLTLYTRGLGELQEAIHNPRTQLLDQTLAAAMAFSLYEVTECPSKHVAGYVSHLSGGLVLLKMRGPDAHTSALGHSLFLFMRTQNFVYSLLERKSNFLSTPEWVSLPWKTSAKDSHDKFMDQMYVIPVLLERTDALDESDADQETLLRGYRELVAEYQANYTKLQRWYRDLQAVAAGPLYWPELSRMPCPAFDETGKGRPFPVAFHFPAFFIGQALILFWAISMVVNNQMARLYRQIAAIENPGGVAVPPLYSISALPSWLSGSVSPVFPPAILPEFSYGTDTAGLPSPGAQSHSSSQSSRSSSPSRSPVPTPGSPLALAAEKAAVGRTMANNICQSIEYFLQDSMGEIGSISMLLPLTVVRHAISRRQPDPTTRPGPPHRPNAYSDQIVWVDFLIKKIGGMGHLMALYLDE